MVTLEEFRQKLEEATDRTHPREHAKHVDGLKDIYPHNISCLSNPLINDKLIPIIINSTVDCFLFVFKNIFSPEMLKVFNEMDFEKIEIRLISEGLLELHNAWSDNDRIVVYFNKNVPVHFGKIDNETIISKWGKGNVWRHELWQVPLSYGDTVKFSNGQVNEPVFWNVVKRPQYCSV